VRVENTVPHINLGILFMIIMHSYVTHTKVSQIINVALLCDIAVGRRVMTPNIYVFRVDMKIIFL
jgi:hypothetical protein